MTIGNTMYKRTYIHYTRDLTQDEFDRSLLAIKPLKEPLPDSTAREFVCQNAECPVEVVFVVVSRQPQYGEKLRCPQCRKRLTFLNWSESRVMLPVPFVNN